MKGIVTLGGSSDSKQPIQSTHLPRGEKNDLRISLGIPTNNLRTQDPQWFSQSKMMATNKCQKNDVCFSAKI